MAIHFRLAYIVRDAHLDGHVMTFRDPQAELSLSLRERPRDEVGYKPNDVICEVLYSPHIPSRLERESIETGTLSIKKKAVNDAYQKMYELISVTVRVVRWRQGGPSHHNPIRLFKSFDWSLDKAQWKRVSETIKGRIRFSSAFSIWSSELAASIEQLVLSNQTEPIGHELFHEAEGLAETNPRSAIIVAVAAAEVGFKGFVAKLVPECNWLLLNVASPPLVNMLIEFLPTIPARQNFGDQQPSVPTHIIDALKKAVTIRNELVHGRSSTVGVETVLSILKELRDFLYLLDFYSGAVWAVGNLSYETQKWITSASVVSRPPKRVPSV